MYILTYFPSPRCFATYLFTEWQNYDSFKFKAFAEDKTIVTENMKFVLERIENIVGKGENAGYQHFHHFPQCCQKASHSGLL